MEKQIVLSHMKKDINIANTDVDITIHYYIDTNEVIPATAIWVGRNEITKVWQSKDTVYYVYEYMIRLQNNLKSKELKDTLINTYFRTARVFLYFFIGGNHRKFDIKLIAVDKTLKSFILILI